MVNKKQTKITVELITKKSVISTRPTMPQEKKNGRERRKYLKPKKYQVFKKKEAACVREYRLKRKMSEQLQVSIFNRTNFEWKCSQNWKITPIQFAKEDRRDRNSCQNIQSVHNKLGRKKNELIGEEEEWSENFLERSEITYTTAGRMDTVYVGMYGSKRKYKQKRYLLWKLRDLLEIIYGFKVITNENFRNV